MNSADFRYASTAPPPWTVARFRLENTGSVPIVYRVGNDGLIAEFELRTTSGEWQPTSLTDCTGLLGVTEAFLEPNAHVLLWLLLRDGADHTHLRIPVELARPTGKASVYTAVVDLNRS